MAGDLDQLGAHFPGGDQRSAAGDHQRAAGEGAPAVRRIVGVAVDHLDLLRRDADLVGDDLRQRGAEALAVRRRADARFHAAGRIDADDHRFPARHDLGAARREGRAAVAGALGESRKADAEMAPLRARLDLPRAERRHVDRLHRHFQRLLIARLVEHQAGRGRIREFVDQVAAADVDRVEPEGGGRLVHGALEREGQYRARHAAIGRHGAGVGDDAARAAGIGAEVVWAWHFRHGHQRLDPAGGGEAGIGADIGDDLVVECDQPRVLVEGGLEREVLVARMEAGDQVLAPVLAPGHRAFEFARQPDQHDIFRGERHFLPEAAADVGCDHAQFAFRHGENVGDGGAREMRHLRGAGQRDAAGGCVVSGMAAARLDRRGVLPARARLDGDGLGGARPHLVETGRCHHAFDDDIAGRFGVDLRRAGVQALRARRSPAWFPSMSSTTSSARSSASASVPATTAATISPVKRTSPSARMGWPTGR